MERWAMTMGDGAGWCGRWMVVTGAMVVVVSVSMRQAMFRSQTSGRTTVRRTDGRTVTVIECRSE